MTLDPKALEAAVDDWISRCGYLRREGDVRRATDQQRLDYLIARFINAADLVPRKEMNTLLMTIGKSAEERDEARAQVVALRAELQSMIDVAETMRVPTTEKARATLAATAEPQTS